MKLKFHENNSSLRGNFSVSRGTNLPSIVKDLTKYLGIVMVEVTGVLVGVVGSTDLSPVVLWRPIVDEAVNAFRLLKSIIPPHTSQRLIYEAEMLIWKLPDIRFVSCNVPFPRDGERIRIPKERWPGIRSLRVGERMLY
jgi:hypothetical protein